MSARADDARQRGPFAPKHPQGRSEVSEISIHNLEVIETGERTDAKGQTILQIRRDLFQ